MTPEQRERRKRTMQRSMALGHCICDPRKPCPCDLFKEQNVCECAGERLPVAAETVRLTETVRSPGCASKIGKADLRAVLAGLPAIEDARVVVGTSAGDDAGVILLDDKTATVLTVDVFAPSVDDPATFGRIAAANSVSDIYAMGAVPQAALSIIGFPIHSLPRKTMAEILRGGIETLKAASVPVVGGHSINDEEVKCGFAVLGTAPAGGFVTNTGAQPGDAIVLTKPLGVGIVAFGHQIGRADDAAMDEAAASMAALNAAAGAGLQEAGAHAATDVTGFSLLGHMLEIVRTSDVAAEIEFDAIPFFSPVQELARRDVFPGAVERNREACDPALLDFSGLTDAQCSTLFCPETSGGLLVFLPQEQAEAYVQRLRAEGVAHAAMIGRVPEACAGGCIRVTTRQAESWTPIRPEPVGAAEPASVAAPGATLSGEEGGSSCCASPDAAAAAPAPDASAAASPAGTAAETGGFLAPLPPAAAEAFQAFSAQAFGAGALDAKTKKLMALALSVVTQCATCVKLNTKAAREAGATDEELGEAAALGVAFGGASVSMFYKELLQRK